MAGVLEWLPQDEHLLPQRRGGACEPWCTCPPQRVFVGWEVGCFGLPASGRTLEFRRGATELRTSGRTTGPLLLERLTIKGGCVIGALGGLADHSTTGTVAGIPCRAAELQTGSRPTPRHPCGGLGPLPVRWWTRCWCAAP